MTETSTLTAQEMADRIAELEGDVLALRGALGNFASGYELNGAPLPLTRELEQAWDALIHTAQAGREAEAQAVLRFAEDEQMSWPTTLAKALAGAAKEYANRLRNGGSDNA